MWLLALLGQPADAADSWDLLLDALLAESAYADLQSSGQTYEQIVRTLPVEDPSRAQALFALGRARAELGDATAAREVLLEGIRTGTCLDPCYELLGRIELEEESITDLPVRWTFDTPEHGFFHPWRFNDKGTIRIQRHPERGDGVLAWHTVIDLRKGDQLVVGMQRPRPAPRRVALQVQARSTQAWLQFVVVDDAGRIYVPTAGNVGVPTDRMVKVVVDLRSMQPLDPLDPRLDPSRISQLQIRDVSALEGAPPGPNTLFIDDFVVE